MKKWLLFLTSALVLMFLVACTETKDENKDDVSKPDDETVIQDPQESKLDQANAAQNHLDSLYFITENIGYMADETNFYGNEYVHGLVYAQLVDFNEDGVDELVTIIKGSEFYVGEPNSAYAKNHYTFEVRGVNGEDYGVLYAREILIDECNACDLSISLVELADGGFGFLESSSQMAQGVSFTKAKLYVMEETGEFTFTETYEETGASSAYLIDGEAVEEEEYAAFLAQYEVDRYLITSESGTKAFGEFAGSVGKMVSDIYKSYEKYTDIETILSKGTTMEPHTLKTEAEYVHDIYEADVLDKSLYDRMITYVILYTDIEAEYTDDNYFPTIPFEKVAVEFERTFGVPLQEEDVDFPGLDELESDEFHYLYFENGVFYLTPTDFGTMEVIRTVERAVLLDNFIYLEVSDIEFDSFAYFQGTLMEFEEQKEFLSEPIEAWPTDALPFAKSNMPRFLLMRIDEGAAPAFLYIGSRPLSFEEIERYMEL